MAATVEKKWVRYLSYGFVILFTAVHFFSCVYMHQMEEIGTEAEHSR